MVRYSSIKHLWDLFRRYAREWNNVNNFMDHERALHKQCNNSYDRGSEANFEHDETWCGWSYQILSNDVTFKARPLCNLTRCTALWKCDIPKKVRYYDC